MSESDAKKILGEHGGDCYLTRVSQTNQSYVLTVVRNGEFENFAFKKTDSGFEIDGSGKKFDDLRNLLKFYRKRPISYTFNGIGDYLQSPNYEPPEDKPDNGIVCKFIIMEITVLNYH